MAELTDPTLKARIEQAVASLTPDQKSALVKQLEAKEQQAKSRGGALNPAEAYYLKLLKPEASAAASLPPPPPPPAAEVALPPPPPPPREVPVETQQLPPPPPPLPAAAPEPVQIASPPSNTAMPPPPPPAQVAPPPQPPNQPTFKIKLLLPDIDKTQYMEQYIKGVVVQQLIDHLGKHYTMIKNPELYGIYWPENQVWLDPKKSFESYGLVYEQMLQYVRIPRPMNVKAWTGEVKTLEWEPKFDVKTAIQRLCAAFGKSAIEGTGIFVPPPEQGKPGKWLDDDAVFEYYRGVTIELRPRTIDVVVVPPSKVKSNMSFESTMTASAAFSYIMQTFPSEINPEVHGLHLVRKAKGNAKEQVKNVWLTDAPNDILKSFQIKETDVLMVKLKPRPYRIALVLEEEVEVDCDTPVATVINSICKKFNGKLNHPHQWSLVPLREGAAYKVPVVEDADIFGEQFTYDSSLSVQMTQAGVSPDVQLFMDRRVGSTLGIKLNSGDADEEEQVEEVDVQLWDEISSEESANNVMWGEEKDGQKTVQAGTLNKLVEYLTHDKQHDMTFVKTFLLTYQSFTTPDKLLEKLFQRARVPRPLDISEVDYQKMRSVIHLRVGNVIKQWLDTFFEDFTPDMITTLSAWLKGEFNESNPGFSQKLLEKIAKSGAKGDKEKEKERIYGVEPPPPIMPMKIGQVTFWDIDPMEVARQLSIVEFATYAKIKPTECLNQAWSKPKLQHRSPNLLSFINNFNRISQWIVNDIIGTERLKARAKKFEYLVQLAVCLKELHNYSSLTSVLAGLNNSSVLRLKWTKAECPKKTMENLDDLEKLMTAEGSYKHYRAEMHAVQPPVIPYIAVFLSDLTFIGDGNPNNLEKLINFGKRQMEYRVIFELQQYQQTGYNLKAVPNLLNMIQEYIEPLSACDDAAAYKLSLVREPRGADRSELLV